MSSSAPRKPQSRQTLYRQLKQVVLERIQSGQWQPGEMIPSENRLVEEFGMSRMTVNRALRELTDEGYLVRTAGVGTFIAEIKPQSNLLMIVNIADEIRARGHRYHCEVLALGRVSAPLSVAAAMEIATGHSVFHLRCIHYEEGVAVQLEDRYVAPTMVPDFLDQFYGDELQPARYLLDHVPVDEMEHIVDALLPEPGEAADLDMSTSEPCLALVRRTWAGGNVVTYVRFLHPSSRYRLGSRFPAGTRYHAG
ncbi:histidine utilization repressor [Salinicola rhizosphaerae]|uniref:Histidine utilization repressor n=1 Tax=Salinicola rhizosphaerae TaxID=1443141 RepID=A0ABQ3E3L8_9GAMM|nr:histidine utilization repressor [Salinicola rhizosphaerae]GHB18343.1 histidine utilization repressor [Salinicola rhizosphaerae]